MIDHETLVDPRHYCLIFAAATLGKLNGVDFNNLLKNVSNVIWLEEFNCVNFYKQPDSV